MSILDFATDPGLLNLSLSPAQRTILKSFYGLDLTPEEAIIFRELAERDYEARPYSELCVIAGARSGKDSRIAMPIAVYEAFQDHSYLAAGETGLIAVIAQDSRAGQIAFGYIRAAIEGSALLSVHIREIRKSEIELDNGILISVYPCSYRAPRGFTIVCAIADELAFWRDETSANPDVEILRSIRRGMASVSAAKLVKISTPYGKSGALYDDYVKRQTASDVLVVKAPTWRMNPSISQRFLDREREKDPAAFTREFGAEFSEDIASFLPGEVIQSATREYLELGPEPHRFRYVASCDPAAGGADSFTMAIGHRDGQRIVVDLARGWRALKPEDVVAEIVTLLRMYRIQSIVGDRFSGMWVRDAFRRRGISYIVADRTRSEFYVESVAPFNQGRIDLPNHPTLIRELRGLERRTSRNGKDDVNHPVGRHDDYCNSAAIVIVKLADFNGKRTASRGRLLWDVDPHPSATAENLAVPDLPDVEPLSADEILAEAKKYDRVIAGLIGQQSDAARSALETAVARKRLLEAARSVKLRRPRMNLL